MSNARERTIKILKGIGHIYCAVHDICTRTTERCPLCVDSPSDLSEGLPHLNRNRNE